MAKTGRPTTYTPEIADAICEEIATTDHALHRICEREGIPDHATVYRWLASNQDFCDKYARARERQADFMAAQTVDIADDTSKDNSFAGSVAVARSRLRALMVGRSRPRLRLSSISGKRTKKTRFDKYMRQEV